MNACIFIQAQSAATGSNRRSMPSRQGKTARSGATIIESLVAIAVLCIAGAWLLGAYVASIHLAEVSTHASIATSHIGDMMERIKATPFSNLQTDFPDGAINGIVGQGQDKYGIIVGGYTLENEQIIVTHQPSVTADPRELIVQISWVTRGRTYQRSLSTIRSSKAS